VEEAAQHPPRVVDEAGKARRPPVWFVMVFYAQEVYEAHSGV